MPITRINDFQAAEGRADDLFEFLQALVPFIASSEGCLSCEVLRSTEHQQRFVVIEQWESIALHQQSLGNYPKEQMQAAMPLFGAPPKGEYFQG